MKQPTVIVASLLFAAVVMPVWANDSLTGRYSCDLDEAVFAVQAMDLRASGYVFMDVQLGDVKGKHVGTYEVDGDYLIVERKDGYHLFLISESKLISESFGATGECVRAVGNDSALSARNATASETPDAPDKPDGSSTVSSQLEGLWQSKAIGLQIRFGKDGVAESTFLNEPVIKGSWEQLSPDSIAMTFRGNSAATSNRKVYSFDFTSPDKLELRSDSNTTLLFDRVQ